MAKRRRNAPRGSYGGQPKKTGIVTHCQCTKITFSIYTKRPGVGRAAIEYEYSIDDGDTRKLAVKLPVVSLWVDDTSNNAVKAHLKVSPGSNPTHRNLVALIKKVNLIKCPGDNAHRLSYDGDRIIRYGVAPGLRYSHKGEGFWDVDFFDSRVDAIHACIDVIKESKQVAGLEMVSFANVSPKLLEELGFTRHPDKMRRSVDMWSGTPNYVISGRGRSYGSYRDSRDNAELILEAISQQVMD